MSQISPAELQRLFPNASKAVRERNNVPPTACQPATTPGSKSLKRYAVDPFPARPGSTAEAECTMRVPVKQQVSDGLAGITTDEEKLNKTERRWLAILRTRGYSFVGIQCLTLKLGHDCRYTPDFMTVAAGREITLWDSKGGHTWEDSLIKMRACANKFPCFRFIIAQWKDNQWTEKVVKP